MYNENLYKYWWKTKESLSTLREPEQLGLQEHHKVNQFSDTFNENGIMKNFKCGFI